MDIHYILGAVLHFYYLFGVSKNSNIAMKKIINEMKDVAQEPRVISENKFTDMVNAVKSGKLKKQDALNEKVYALTEFQYETIQSIEV